MRRTVAGLVFLLLLASAAYLFFVAEQIKQQSTAEEARKADLIIVLGAAEYRGRPSPVLQGRLEHAFDLYRHGLAPLLLSDGGAGGDPDYTEGEVGRAYLVKRGVPSESILVEPAGATTAQSLDAATEIMQRNNLHSCIVVSDGYHIYRVKRLLQRRNVVVYGSPSSDASPGRSVARLEHTGWLYLRQAVGFAMWQLGVNI